MKNVTKRNCVSAIEEILEQSIKVLDHGFIRVIDYMGDDASVVQAARVSYGRGTKKVSQDRGLIRYLMRNQHMTPFEMCEIKFHVKLPIFIARQWIRHRTASVNEYSARYSILSKEFYLPSKDILASQSKTNKQGRAQESIPDTLADDYLELFKDNAETCYANYRAMLNEDDKGDVISTEKVGIARELARTNLSLNYYTEWYWKVNLRNLLHFISLRADSHAQYEIREYANKILDIVKLWVPYSFEAFNDYVLNAAVISQQGLDVIRKMIKGESITADNSQLSTREWEELTKLILDD